MGLAPDLSGDDLMTLRTLYLRDLYAPYTPANPPNPAVAEIALSVFNMTAKMNFFTDAQLQSLAASVWYDNEAALLVTEDFNSAVYESEHSGDTSVETDAVTFGTQVRLGRWLSLTAAAALTVMLMDGRFLSAFSTKTTLAEVLKAINAQIKSLRWGGVAFMNIPTVRA